MFRISRARRGAAPTAAAVLAVSALGGGFALAQEGDNGVDEVQPSPGAFGTDVPVTYQGPPPSGVKKEFIGPHELVRAGDYDLDKGTVTLPLYRGEIRKSGRPVWYVLTDTSDTDEADSLGLNFSPKLKYSDVDFATRKAKLVRGNYLRFKGGTVDFLARAARRARQRRGRVSAERRRARRARRAQLQPAGQGDQHHDRL